MQKQQRGFTIIELLVVIAIIAVLGTIVFVNVSSRIVESQDAKVKGDLSQISKSLIIYYSQTGSYTGYTIPTSTSSACSGSTYTIYSTQTTYAAFAKLCSTGNYWCIDSTGDIVQLQAAPNSGTYTCQNGSICGNNVCEQNENSSNCPQDCPPGPPPSNCGDGVIQSGEQCDGSNLNGQTCVGEGYGSGTLVCNSDCTFDFSRCVPAGDGSTCGDGGYGVGPGGGGYCGDGICQLGETADTCPQDCAPTRSCNYNCNCDSGENSSTCSHDCPNEPI
jgi:prepilin-type N-terminal cleavage/methylation domain-containing protein